VKTIFGVKDFSLSEYAIAANAVLGIRDSGKTYTATEATEELFDAGIPSLWLDPIGVAHNLRIPGKGRGYPIVVAGGRFGDLPLTVKNAGAIVRAAMQQGVSLVIDLFSTELSKADWRKIVRECVEILLYENHDFGLRHVFIEEAAEFVPQRVTDGLVFAAVEKLVRMGGNSKLGCTLINQRSEDLNKSVLELCANVFLHRQRGKNSLTGMKKWLDLVDPDEAKRVMDSVPDLKSGQCWVLSNELKHPVLLKVPEKNSLHPDRRAAATAPGTPRKAVPADKFVDAMKAALAEKPKVVQSDTKTPPLVSKPAPAAAHGINPKDHERAIAAAREAGYSEGWVDGWRKGYAAGNAQGVKSTLNGIGEVMSAIRTADPLVPPNAPVAPRAPKTSVDVHQRTSMYIAPVAQQVERRASNAKVAGSSPAGRSNVRDRILGALAELEAIGIKTPPRIQVAFLSNYKHDGVPNFRNTAGALRSEGLIVYPDSGTMQLTDAGRAEAPKVEMPMTSADLHQRIIGLLDGVERRILPRLIAVFPFSIERDELARSAGYAHAGVPNFRNSLGRLRSLGFVDYPSTSTAVARPTLFLEER
jgi:uncharacterized protein